MSLIYEGRFYAFPPMTVLPEAGVTVIRPMMYVPEKRSCQFCSGTGNPDCEKCMPGRRIDKKRICQAAYGAD